MRKIWFLMLILGCSRKEPAPATVTPPATAPAPATQALPTLTPRPGGPGLAACEKAADNLAGLVTQAAAPSGLTEKELAYVTGMVHDERRAVVRFCLETAAVQEIDCVIAARDFGSLAGCERFRREIPEDLIGHREATLKDCERFFDRLRQFKLEEGADPKEVDQTRDQIIRACQEKAKPGTIACFLASPSYAQARMCP